VGEGIVMAQHSRYPEHEIIGYGNDLEGHLEMLSALGSYITPVGVIIDEESKILTFDRPASGRKPLISATLPQATLHVEELEVGESFEEGLVESIAERFEFPEDIEMEVIGKSYAFGRDNHIDAHPRVYIPVLHHGITNVHRIQPHSNIRGSISVMRTANEILDITKRHDETDGIRGQRSRAVTRFVIDVYKSMK
jgi:hypothetical protein